MPQELHVLRCFACKTFQVQIVKKVPKWQCKVCNEKQSVLKVYATGSGKDCRQYVQDLNMQQGLLKENESEHVNVSQPEIESYQVHEADFSSNGKISKWNEFLEECGPKDNSDQPSFHNWEGDEPLKNSSILPISDKPTHNKHISKWNSYLGEENQAHDPGHTPMNDGNDEHSFEHFKVFRGRKRKFNQSELYERKENSGFEEGCQQSVITSLARSAQSSNVFESSVDRKGKVRKGISSTSEIPSQLFKSSNSKWSQFITTSERTVPSTEVGKNFSKTDSEKYKTSDSYESDSNSTFCGADILSSPTTSSTTSCATAPSSKTSRVKISGDIPTRKSHSPAGLKTSLAPVNPFCTTMDDENLDTLLDL